MSVVGLHLPCLCCWAVCVAVCVDDTGRTRQVRACVFEGVGGSTCLLACGV